MKRAIILLGLAAGLLSGCTNDDCDPASLCGQPESFRLQIIAKNPDGSPAAGLKVSAWSNLTIPVSKVASRNGGATTLRFDIPEDSFVQLDILDGNDQLVRRLLTDDVVRRRGFSFSVVWDTRDDLGQPVPNGVYRAQFTAQDSMQNTLFTASEYGYRFNPEAISATIGSTDSQGIFQTDNTLLFPGIGNAPVMTHRNSEGVSLGTFTATDSTSIVLRDDQGGFQSYGVRLRAGSNTLELTWPASPRGLKDSEPPPAGPAPSRDTHPGPPTAFAFYGFTPNPFF